MSRKEEQTDIEKDKSMLEDVLSSKSASNGIELSSWEEEFIESIGERLSGGRALTEKQHDKLKDIWDKV